MKTYISYYDSPLGRLTLGSDGEHLTGLWYNRQKYDRAGVVEPICEDQLPVFDETKRWLDEYFAGRKPSFTPSLKIIGTEFRKLVCEQMLLIPYGQTTSYREIAQKVAKLMGREKMSAQAVGGAVGHNPIGIIIPCHRVVGTNGKLTGYAGGLDRKEYLLRLEQNKE